MLRAQKVIAKLQTTRKGPELLAAAQKLRELNFGFTAIAKLLKVPELRSWLYEQLVDGPRKHPEVPAALLAHLREDMAHALGGSENCSDCQSYGLKPCVCLECGRSGFENLGRHLLLMHPECANDEYREEHGYNRTTPLVSQHWHQKRSLQTDAQMKLMRARRERVKPPSPAGLRWKNRTQALQSAAARRSIENRRAPRNVPAQFRRKHTLSLWAVAKLRLQGKTTLQIATHLDSQKRTIEKHSPLHQKVEAMCRSLGLGGEPSRYWRGQRLTSQHVRDARSDFRIRAKDLAAAMKIRERRLAVALSGKDRPLSLDLADRFLVARRHYTERRQSASPTSTGGHMPLLCPSEKKAITWQRKILAAEIRQTGDDLSKPRPPATLGDTRAERSPARLSPEETVGESLCRLKRQQKISALFFWAADFVPWLLGQYALEPNILINQSGQITREFIASQYGQSENTIYLERSDREERLSLKARLLLLDTHQNFNGREEVPTQEIVAALRKHRRMWRRLSSKELAGMLRTAGAAPKNMRVGRRVVKAYRLSSVPLYSTAQAAHKLSVHSETLQLLTRNHRIPAPPLLRRVGIQAGGRVRFWTDVDIRLALFAIAENRAKAR